MVPITPIIYGNGTMLSDIGEVTEAESTVMGGIGARRMQARMAKTGGNTPLESSPTVPYQSAITAKKKALSQHKRNVSSESGSTVLTERDTTNTDHHFKEFDDTVSMGGESPFQGDDEESLADYSFGEPMVAETRTIYGKKESRMVDMAKEKKEEELSSAALSRRAEMILANAKKRLDVSAAHTSESRARMLTCSRIWRAISTEHEALFTLLHRRQCLRSDRFRHRRRHYPEYVPLRKGGNLWIFTLI